MILDFILGLSVVLIGIVIVLFILSFYTVGQQNIVMIERFGRFLRAASPGFHWKLPGIDRVSGVLNLRIQQLEVRVETKTQDNVFVNILVATQYRVIPEQVYDAFYKLENPDEQIKAYIFDVVRANVPTLVLDDVFSRKDDIAKQVKKELRDVMQEFGYEIIQTLITDIQPNENVKKAMNEINTAQRLRIAAQEKGEADKILRVKHAEAEAESNILHGKGIAGQRAEIIEGLSHSLGDMQKATPGLKSTHIMEMVLVIQYLDMLREIGGASNTNTVFIEHSPQNIETIGNQIRNIVFAPKPEFDIKSAEKKSTKKSK